MFSLKELPLVELGAVAQGEAGHEVVAVELRRFGERREAVGADVSRRVLVELAVSQPLTELLDIQPDLVVLPQANRLSIGFQPGAGARGVQHREGPPQVGPCAGLIVLWPEQRRQGIPGMRLGGNSQVGEEGNRLPRINFDGLAIPLCAWRAEEEQP